MEKWRAGVVWRVLALVAWLPIALVFAPAAEAVTPMVAAGGDTTIGLAADGTVWIWGDGGSFLGYPAQVTGLPPIKAVAAGRNHFVALASDGTVWSWGRNDYGQLGNNSTTDSPTPVQVKGPNGAGFLTGIDAVAAGARFTIALASDGTVWTWGTNDGGQLGTGDAYPTSYYYGSLVPIQVKGVGDSGVLYDVRAVAAGDEHAVALKWDGTVLSWGFNPYSQIEDYGLYADYISTRAPVVVWRSVDQAAQAVAAGGNHTVILDVLGCIRARGANDSGQLGDGTTVGEKGWVDVVGTDPQICAFGNVVAIAAGASHTVALKSDGTAWAWGDNSAGQLGDGSVNNSSVPVQMGGAGFAPLGGFQSFAAGWSHTVALTSDRTVLSWGDNSYAQLGDGGSGQSTANPVQANRYFGNNTSVSYGITTFDLSGSPNPAMFRVKTGIAPNTSVYSNVVAVGGLAAPAPISISGGEYSINFGPPVSTPGTVQNGQYLSVRLTSSGNLNTTSHAVVTIGGVNASFSVSTQAAKISAGASHNLAIDDNGDVWSWGGNNYGQLGDGTHINSSVPVKVAGISNVIAVAAGEKRSLAVKADGTVWGWGFGIGTLVPVRLYGPINAVAVADGDSFSAALQSDGTVWTWGSSGAGPPLGHPTGPLYIRGPTAYYVAKVTGLDAVTSIAAGLAHMVALTRGGRVFKWGGVNAGGNTFTPTDVGLANITAVSAGAGYSVALGNISPPYSSYLQPAVSDAPGAIWAWGDNTYGQLGPFGNWASRTSVPSGWTAISAGYTFALARNGSGQVYAWGLNMGPQKANFGQLNYTGALDLCGPGGTNLYACAHTPVQTSATGISMAAGGTHAIALGVGGTFLSWGNNATGQLGKPIQTPPGTILLYPPWDPIVADTSNPTITDPQTSSVACASSGTSSFLSFAGCVFSDTPIAPTGPANSMAVTVSNATSAAAAVSKIEVSDGGGNGFTVASNTCGASIAAFSSCVVNLAFLPPSIGAKSATLTVNVPQFGAARAIPFSGKGVASQSPVVPGAPTIGTATAGNASVSVSFTAPANDGGAAITGYTVTSSTGGITKTGTTSPIVVTGLTNGTSYRFTATATNAIGTSPSSALSNSVTPGETQAPTVPAGLTATPVSSSQINLAWSASTDNVGVIAYQLFRGGVFRTTVNAPTLSFNDGGLAASTSYNYKVTACDAAGNCSAQSAQATATTLAPGQVIHIPKLDAGFNLGSNALNTTLNVTALFGNQDAPVGGVTSNIVSVWKWNAVAGRWAFYSPQLTVAGNTSYAASHSYDALSAVNPGEGFWMNATNPITLPAQTGTTFNWNGVNFAALPTGFNLIAQADTPTPSEFNRNVSATPPATGVVPTNNFVSLWVWDAVAAKWYFYSPLLEASGGLPAVKAYADSHNYLHFQDYGKTLGLGTGFWVNRP